MATQSPSWPTRTTRTSLRNRSAQNGWRMGVNCLQPSVVARHGRHHHPAGTILDPREGFLVWFSRKSGTSSFAEATEDKSRDAADVLAGSSGKQISYWLDEQDRWSCPLVPCRSGRWPAPARGTQVRGCAGTVLELRSWCSPPCLRRLRDPSSRHGCRPHATIRTKHPRR